MNPELLLDAIEMPWLLVLAVVLPVLFYFLLRRARRTRAQRLERLGSLAVVRRLVPPTVLGSSGWRMVRLGGAALFAGIALAGPRWGVERTFAWCGQRRRLSKDYERLCATSEALLYAVMTRIMLRRLARA